MTFHHRIIELPIRTLRPYPRNARRHSKKQLRQIADSIERFGFTNPVLVGDDGEIVAGHGRVEAARLLGMETVPTIALSHLNATERRAYVLADNKLALNAGWDEEILALELQDLIDLDFDLTVTGFSVGEIDLVLDTANESAPDRRDAADDWMPEMEEAVVSRPGDLWQLGRHRLICADARDPDAYGALLAGEQVDMIFTDPPYHVPIDGHVSGLGRVHHREFAMGAGEMSEAAFEAFLLKTRTGVCVQGRYRAPYQYVRFGRRGPVPDQRVGLRRHQQSVGDPRRGTGDAPDRKTGRPGGRCGSRLLETRG